MRNEMQEQATTGGDGEQPVDLQHWRDRVHALDETVHGLREHAAEDAHGHNAEHPHRIHLPKDLFRHRPHDSKTSPDGDHGIATNRP